jgi:hypothetical protein
MALMMAPVANLIPMMQPTPFWNRISKRRKPFRCVYTKSYNWLRLRPMARKARFRPVLSPTALNHSYEVQGQAINVKFDDTLVPQARLVRRAFESQMP